MSAFEPLKGDRTPSVGCVLFRAAAFSLGGSIIVSFFFIAPFAIIALKILGQNDTESYSNKDGGLIIIAFFANNLFYYAPMYLKIVFEMFISGCIISIILYTKFNLITQFVFGSLLSAFVAFFFIRVRENFWEFSENDLNYTLYFAAAGAVMTYITQSRVGACNSTTEPNGSEP